MSDSDSDVVLSKRVINKALNSKCRIKDEMPDSDSQDNMPLSRRINKKRAPKKSTNSKATKIETKTQLSKKNKPTPKRSVKQKKSLSNKNENDSENDEITKDIKNQFREGQKFITPPNGDATRAFYESLYNENPYSIIALKYCVENGVLMGAKHSNANERLECLRENGLLKRSLGGLQNEAVECLRRFDAKKGGFSKG
ncbi:hypothetical protein HWI79_1421 [Cryptosporidium felis]|nr:hypothetical protein HWI79_1421 [Cryptosporidium felis]